MRCLWPYTKNQKRCKNDCCFLLCKSHWKQLIVWLFPLLASVVIANMVEPMISPDESFDAVIQVVDWNNTTSNPEIYNKGGVVYINGIANELTKTNNGTFKFQSDKERKINVYFQPEKRRQFMKLDTTIFLSKDSSAYRLKMYFRGIDKITRIVEDRDGNPVVGAIAEINGITDTTTADGKFTISLPLDKQKQYQELTIRKTGFVDYHNRELDMTTDNRFIIWEMQKK